MTHEPNVTKFNLRPISKGMHNSTSFLFDGGGSSSYQRIVTA